MMVAKDPKICVGIAPSNPCYHFGFIQIDGDVADHGPVPGIGPLLRNEEDQEECVWVFSDPMSSVKMILAAWAMRMPPMYFSVSTTKFTS